VLGKGWADFLGSLCASEMISESTNNCFVLTTPVVNRVLLRVQVAINILVVEKVSVKDEGVIGIDSVIKEFNIWRIDLAKI